MTQQVIPDDVKAAMWQFCLKTSIPRLIEQKRKEYADQMEIEKEAEQKERKD